MESPPPNSQELSSVGYAIIEADSYADQSERNIELFNIGEDPYEENEISSAHPDKVKELIEKI